MSSFPSKPNKAPNSTIENYFDIGDILGTQEKVPCKFEVEVQNLGFLECGSDSRHLPAGSKMDIPFWLAKALCSRRRHTVSIELPKFYREGYREILGADAAVVDLHKWGPYYYNFGSYLLHFEHPESPSIAKALLQLMQDRFRGIMDASQNASHKEVSAVSKKLDQSEEAIFRSGQKGLRDLHLWQTRQTEKLATSSMVLTHRKRKRIQMETS